MSTSLQRCVWVKHPLEIAYHDTEWGKPIYDDRLLFELLILESAQAGLSWLTVLKRREGYRQAFDGFDPEKMAQYSTEKITALMQDTRIIRHRLKILSAVNNAKAMLQLKATQKGFSDFIWQFVEGVPQTNQWRSITEVPAKTPVSDALSKALKRAGFSFVGSTICYAFMQAVGMVNDHQVDCFCHPRHSSR